MRPVTLRETSSLPFPRRSSGSQAPRALRSGIQNESGFYFDFENVHGPYFVPGSHSGIVYRNPVPELFALQSLESCLLWREMSSLSRQELVEYGSREAYFYENPSEWGANSGIVTDVETGVVLQIILESARGRVELSTFSLSVTPRADIEVFSWHGPTRSFEGAQVKPLT